MTEPRCDCWKPSEPHGPTCPVAREQARTERTADRLLEGIAVPERAEWDQPVGGWEPRT